MSADTLTPEAESKPRSPANQTKKMRNREITRNRLLTRTANYQGLLLAIVVLATMYVARGFLLPVFGALLLAYAMMPIVRRLNHLGIPRVGSAFIACLFFTAAMGLLATTLAEPAIEWVSRAPQAMNRVEELLKLVEQPMQSVTAATEQLTKMTEGSNKKEVVAVDDGNIVDVVVAQTPILLGALVTTIVLLFFLLAYGDLLLRRFVEISPKLRDKKRAIETAREIEVNVSHYLLTITIINISLGITLGGTLAILGFENPLLWGTIATLFNFVPYVGAIAGVFLVALAAIISFENLYHAALFPSIYFALTVLEGNFITPMILGRSFRINPIFIVLSLLFLGWLWGVPGAVMAVPLLIAVKGYAQQMSSFKDFARILER